jgi:hypothetical protein
VYLFRNGINYFFSELTMAVTPFFPDVILAWKASSILYGHELPAQEFLAAAKIFVPIFGKNGFVLGTHFFEFLFCLSADRLGPVFSPVKGDVGGNIDKLLKQYMTHPDKRTVQQLVLHEREMSPRIDPNGAASALLWYSRYHGYISKLFLIQSCLSGLRPEPCNSYLFCWIKLRKEKKRI